jgi:hypothetical protein
MKLEIDLDLIFSGVILACAIPAWAHVFRKKGLRAKPWKALFLVTLSLLEGLLFVNLITFGPFTLDYSLRFGFLGMTLSVLAIVFSRARHVGFPATGITISSGLSLVMWFFFITLH